MGNPIHFYWRFNREVFVFVLKRNTTLKWILLSPAFALTGILIAYPLAYNFYLSFHSWYGSATRLPRFEGFSNYIATLSDPRFWNSIRVTIVFTILALGIEIVAGFFIALYINREFRGKNFIKALFVFPFAATPVAIALVWRNMYDPTLGVINYFVSLIGRVQPVEWLTKPHLVIPSLAFVDIWQWTPLVVLICMAGLEGLPREPIESAQIDGASKWQIFRRIIFPLMGPTLIAATMIRSWDVIKVFDIIYVMTAGGPGFASENLNIYIYNTAFFYFNMGYASSMMVILFAIVLGFNIILYQLTKRGNE
jgi:multiple sugar transport system permease protein